MTPTPTSLIVDAMRAGVLLIADGDRLRFKAIRPVSPDLAQRIKAHRSALLAMLSDKTPGPDKTPGLSPGYDRESGVSSVLSVSEPQQGPKCGRGLWSEDELSTLARAGKTPADLPLALAVKDAFAPAGGATVTLIEPTSDRPSMRPPDPVAALPVLADIGRRGWTCWRDGADLLVNRRQDPPDDALADRIREHKPGILAVLDNLADAGVPRPEPGLLTDLADHYAEREAIMVIDGRVPEADAQRAAWAEALAVAVEPLVKGRGESV